jgi:hypothetical protein
MAVKATYQGNGDDHLTGVPMRDLDQAEYDALTDEQRAAVLQTVGSDGKSLYRVNKKAEMVAAGLAEAPEETADAPKPKPTTQATVAAARGVTRQAPAQPSATDEPATNGPATTEG